MNLNKEQYIAAKHVGGPMLVLAGPGSGKTHLLVERIRMMIEESHIPPESILVITFSNKAARQMRARFTRRVEDNTYPVTFGTFHAVFYHILKEHDPNINRLITEEEQITFVKSLLKDSELFDEFTEPEEVAGLISSYRNLADDFYARNERGKMMDISQREEFERIVAGYDDLCREAHVIDFDDMIILCDRLLRKHESVLRKWRNMYRYFLVDEFQDINEAQYDVLRLLAGDERNVFAVGDDDQSIYAFRGARPELMKKFLHQYVGCRQVTLTMNYRCCENVIGAADTLIRNNIERLQRPMQRHLPSKAGGIVETIHSENTDIQAAFVCDRIDELINEEGYRPGEIAVLYRSTHCAVMFNKIATQRGFRLRTTEGINIDIRRRKIHDAYVRAKENTASRGDWFLIMNNPPRGLSREALCHPTGDYIGDFKAYYSGDEAKLEMVRDLERTVRQYDSNAVISDTTGADDAVNVMTAHASKGLEFSCVFVIGLQEGLFPHYRNRDVIGIEEERRLMYVAMTRAKERLYLCSLGTKHGKRSSRFVDEVAKGRKYIRDTLNLIRGH